MRLVGFAAFCLAVGACSSIPAPVVDMEGVDQAQYNRDLAQCYENVGLIEAGNPVSQCMHNKGYTVLVWN